VRPLRLATRGSAQASTQAEGVAAALRSTGAVVELVFVETTGDRRQDVPLHVIGGQGVFVKEVQRAVLDGRADLAVHSAKDLPSTEQEGLRLGAFCARRSPADALVGRSLAALGAGATVATGAVRRRAQLRRARPDLQFVELRGNIETRLSRVPDDGAIVMAVAALEVLGLTSVVAEVLDPAEFVPAVGQGCVAVECRADDREVLAALGSGCTLPVGAHVKGLQLHTFLAGEVTGVTLSETIALSGDDGDAERARAAARAALDAVSAR
jgi:hydroxymethylbilane synthase